MPGTRESASRFCHLCGHRLAGRYYRNDRGLVYCHACAQNRPHCPVCRAPLEDAAIAHQRDAAADAPRLCAHCLRTTPRCTSCRRHIVGTFYTFEELLPPSAVRRFCESCVRNRPRCDLCRAPVAADAAPLDDGQYRCTLCASEMVLGETPVRVVYDEVLAAFPRVVGTALAERPRLEIVSRLQMGEVRRRYEREGAAGEPGTLGHHVLGYFVRSHGSSAIYVERGLPRSLLLGTLAHELGHAWQAERAPHVRDPLLCEGFAEWVAHHVLIASGLRPVAVRATRREDVYGRGLRHLLEVEQRAGRDGVLALARGAGG